MTRKRPSMKKSQNEAAEKFFTPTFEKLVNTALEKCAGISIAVIDGKSISTKGYGIATFPEIPVTPETIFYCASTTKAFTGAAASLLVDDENHPDFKWDTPISRLVPEDFVLQDEYWTNHITIQDALCHRTGIPGHMLTYDGPKWNVKDITRALRHVSITAEPRTKFQYCNIGYAVVCHTIEHITGNWFGDFLKTSIWDPLSMSSTYFHIRDVQASKKPVAQGYKRNADTETFENSPYNPISGCGAGGIFSTVVDYSKWVQSMIQRSGPLSESGYKEITTPHMLSDDELPKHSTLSYGYGWNITTYRGEVIHMHSGGLLGFSTHVAYFPERGWGCVMMCNTNAAVAIPELTKLRYYLIDELLKVPESERVDWDAYYQESTEASPKAKMPPSSTIKLPTSLPLSAYTGTYSNPGCGSLTVSLKDGKLIIDGSDRTWELQMQFQHISGDHFYLSVQMIGDSMDLTTLAEFHVNSEGVCSRLGAVVEETMAPEMVWFEKAPFVT